MGQAGERRIIAVHDADALARTAADRLLARMAANSGSIGICLTGGSGPVKLYELLVTNEYRARVPWTRVHWFIGDERFVPPSDPLNNMSVACRVFLNACAPVENIHPIPTEAANPGESAARYERELKAFYGAVSLDPARPLFDLVLMGVGPDGHTASLFPGDAALAWLQQVVRDAAARLGVSLSELAATLYDAFGQRQVSTMYLAQNQHKVVLEVDPREALGPDDLKRIHVSGRDGMVPLSTVARVTIGNQAASIQHQNGFPVANLTFNLAPGVSLSQATEVIQRAAEDIGMPASIRAGFQGDARAFQQSSSSQPLLILAALITIYIVLGILYESLIHPLTILSTLPSAGLGALIALILTGYDLSIVALIGIILLIGIVKKNAIMMIDFALEAERERGLSPLEAIREAGLVRFRPIMMTTVTALLGAVPLAFDYGTGGEIRRPLGVAIIGGLLVSQMLTLYTTPVVYLTLERLAMRRRRRAAIAAPAE